MVLLICVATGCMSTKQASDDRCGDYVCLNSLVSAKYDKTNGLTVHADNLPFDVVVIETWPTLPIVENEPFEIEVSESIAERLVSIHIENVKNREQIVAAFEKAGRCKAIVTHSGDRLTFVD